MDYESFMQGYLTGVALHSHMRPVGDRPSVIAALSVTGIAADFEWYADLSNVLAITLITASYVGSVSVRHSFDGETYTEPVAMEELLEANPSILFADVRPDAPSLRFRFHLADDAADLTAFTLYGFLKGATANV